MWKTINGGNKNIQENIKKRKPSRCSIAMRYAPIIEKISPIHPNISILFNIGDVSHLYKSHLKRNKKNSRLLKNSCHNLVTCKLSENNLITRKL